MLISINTGLSHDLGPLQSGREFETVAGHHAVVGVGGGHQRRRITRAGPDVVIRRIGQQGLELLGVVGRAVVVDPRAALGELVEAEHVHHAHRRQAAPKRSGRWVITAPTNSPPLLPP